jgi:hypothetical protein
MSEQAWVISDEMEGKSSVVPQIIAAIGGKNVSMFFGYFYKLFQFAETRYQRCVK